MCELSYKIFIVVISIPQYIFQKTLTEIYYFHFQLLQFLINTPRHNIFIFTAGNLFVI